MGMPLPKVTIELLSEDTISWYVETATVDMLTYEVKRPEIVNIDRLYQLAEVIMNSETAFVARVDGVCAGVIGGALVDNLFNPTLKTLSELIWYVLPEYRNTRAGAMLLKAFISKGEEVADETTFALLHHSPIKIQTLEKRGFHLREFSFLKDNRST